MAVVPAGAQGPAIKRFRREHPDATFEVAQVKPFRYWPLDPPPVGQRHAHAWFAGFLQATGPDGRADWSEPPRIAFAVLIEFGGSGGRVSGPLGKAVAAEVLDIFGENLEVGRKVEGRQSKVEVQKSELECRISIVRPSTPVLPE